jgi:dTDP-4-amino-4,6-dideoxygalactose transaminase
LSTNKNYDYTLIDCDNYFQIDCEILKCEIEKNINKFKNHVVIPVHLYGGSCDMVKIMELKKQFNLKIIEDCSQSHGTITSENKKVGTYGDVSAFSLYPGKNLGAAGDAGIIVTDNEKIYKQCLMIRNLGSIEKYKHDIIGRNSRLDTVQSVILNEKLKKIDFWNDRRVQIANIFKLKIKNELITIPEKSNYCNYNTYHIFPILTNHRESFMNFLKNEGIPSLIHYPIPIEKTKAFFDSSVNSLNTLSFSDKIVSLPMHPFLTDNEVEYICKVINDFKIKNV